MPTSLGLLAHLRRRWAERAALTAVALLLAWSQSTDEPATNAFIALWLVAAVVERPVPPSTVARRP